MPSEDEAEIILEAKGITKVYPGTVALKSVDFRVRRGKVNVLIGENGAGKSTLMKILAGVEQPTEGRVLLNGQEVRFTSTKAAEAHGIGMIYQELNLFPNLSVSDNIFAGRELRNRFGMVDYEQQRQITRTLLARLEEDAIDPDTPVDQLRVGQQQAIEIAKALSQDARILIMDEPTSALSLSEVEVLFRVMAELKAAGVSIIYISHKLDELMRVADYVTILRDGQLVAESEANLVDVPWIVRQMVGRHPDDLYHKERHVTTQELLRVEEMTLNHPYLPDRLVVDRVSFSLHAGEVLGIYGLMGAGRSELLEAIMGRHPQASGKVVLNGSEVQGSIKERLEQGLALIPEDRKQDGFIPTLSVAHNMTLASVAAYLSWTGLSAQKEQEAVGQQIKELSIKVSDPDQLITSLSGGNQQKVVVGKALLTKPSVLMMDEPTRGIDVGAKADIFLIMNRLAAAGYGILFVSSDLNEVLAMADRILVLSRGRLVAEFDHAEATEEALVAAAGTADRIQGGSGHEE